MRTARTATLATVGGDGAPLATLVAVTDDGEGRPLFLLSSLAEHTRNLRQRADASVLVSEGDGATMNRARVTFIGTVRWLEGEEGEATKQRFVATHAEAQVWVTLKDFAPARLELTAVRFVGGFARAQALTPEEYLSA
jgi:putative heme iron utilization protein